MYVGYLTPRPFVCALYGLNVWLTVDETGALKMREWKTRELNV